ncbi:hypothetical protein CRV24_001468 [Beauveria bassiana]|nr:hypothetical protein CRV24_001468 [Beauveria bassiana]KAH8719938.1 hypothetical protein HC256_000346 [Beauveria bassiana]
MQPPKDICSSRNTTALTVFWVSQGKGKTSRLERVVCLCEHVVEAITHATVEDRELLSQVVCVATARERKSGGENLNSKCIFRCQNLGTDTDATIEPLQSLGKKRKRWGGKSAPKKRAKTLWK